MSRLKAIARAAVRPTPPTSGRGPAPVGAGRPGSAGAPAAPARKFLDDGPARPEVRALQQLLNQATAQRLTVDGIPGPKTREALIFLQKRLGVPATGEPDALTLVLALQRIEDSRRKRGAPRRFILDLPLPPKAGARPRRNHLLIDVPTQMFIGKELEEGGLAGYEPETLACFLAALSRKDGGVVLDVGANIGVFSLLASALSDWSVFAFEPTPDLAASARRVAEANGLDMSVEELALGRETGSATFYLSDVTDASNSLAAGFRPSTRSLLVPVERLDDWAARTGVVPDVIKIDTETTEPDVLAGGRELLRKHRPWLLVEVLPGHGLKDLLVELEPLDYTWYHIVDGEPLRASETLEPSDPNRNWLFTPEPIDDAFLADADAWRSALEATKASTTADVAGDPAAGA